MATQTTRLGACATDQPALVIRNTVTNMVYMSFSSSLHCALHAQQRFSARGRAHGFTILEVLVVVAILAVLAALAGPSFGPLIERWRVRNATEDLQSTLYFARSEGIKRGGNVIVMKTANGGGCSNAAAATQWGCGWKVFYDVNQNNAQDTCDTTKTPNECDLQTFAAPNRVEINFASSNGYLTIDRWGQFHSASNNSFNLRLMPQGSDTANPAATALCVGLGGRITRLNKGDATCPS